MSEWELSVGDNAEFEYYNLCVEQRVIDADSGEKFYYVRRDRLDTEPSERDYRRALHEKENLERSWPEEDRWEGDMADPESKSVYVDHDNNING